MQLKELAKTNETVLITGETGTGKSRLAFEIHKISREDSTFNDLNISAIDSNFFNTTLFGYKKGAFTGATNNQEGFCQTTGNGTLFLDEIGDLNAREQVKILQLCEQKKFYPVGETKLKTFNGRLILATCIDLEKAVQEGRFREDLYYRLRYFHLHLRPLRKELELSEIIERELFKRKIFLTNRAKNTLMNYHWPGNYRELVNTLSYLKLLNKTVDLCDLPSWIKKAELKKNYRKSIEEFESDFLKEQFARNDGRVNQTARKLEMNKVTLIKKMKKYNIHDKNHKVVG